MSPGTRHPIEWLAWRGYCVWWDRMIRTPTLRRLVSLAVVVAVVSVVVAPVVARSFEPLPCAAVSMGHDCTREAAIERCCCHARPEIPARVPDRTPGPVQAMDAASVWQSIVVIDDVRAPRRTAPRYGHASTDLFTLFSTFLI